MSAHNECDKCSKKTYINPPTKPLTTKKLIDIKVPIKQKDGSIKVEKQVVEQEVPKMVTMKQQNIHTGDIENVEIQEHEDLLPRCLSVMLSVGSESITKDFCKDCIDYIMPEVKALWNKLESFKSK